MIDFTPFEVRTGIAFRDKRLLTQAFLHRSYINESPSLGLSHNERLEFLGDAVLELAVTEHLYATFPDRNEGDLTAYRSALVNATNLAEAAAKLGMNEFLLLSKGEAKDTGKARHYILANTYEAYVGALHLDQGYAAAKQFIADSLFGNLSAIIAKKLYRDAKSLVQEKAQEYVGVTPSYKVLAESGPDHDKRFTVGIHFGAELIAEGKGKSKQEAETEAAQKALEKKGWMD